MRRYWWSTENKSCSSPQIDPLLYVFYYGGTDRPRACPPFTDPSTTLWTPHPVPGVHEARSATGIDRITRSEFSWLIPEPND
jgi:hypothetical protein